MSQNPIGGESSCSLVRPATHTTLQVCQECPEKQALMDHYEEAVTELNRVLRALKRMIGTITDADWKYATDVLAWSEEAWAALDNHLRTHGC